MDDNARSVEGQLGYLTKAVEDMCVSVDKIAANSKEQDTKLDTRLSKIEDELSLYKTVVKTVKAIALTAIFIVTLKLGNITALWK